MTTINMFYLHSIPSTNGTGSSVESSINVRGPPLPEKYRQISERVKSFSNTKWPPALTVQPGNLCQAGFYYAGPGDRVMCAFCSLVLKKWRPNDTAIEKHVKYSPHCEYVKAIEEQTQVLSRNIRSKKPEDQCISSAELIKQNAKHQKETKQPRELGMCVLVAWLFVSVSVCVFLTIFMYLHVVFSSLYMVLTL